MRAGLLVANNEGLTQTYDRFNNPNEDNVGILQLRDLHDALDRAVLDADGWTDMQPKSEFLLDYEEEKDTSSRRRKPYRYRWQGPVTPFLALSGQCFFFARP